MSGFLASLLFLVSVRFGALALGDSDRSVLVWSCAAGTRTPFSSEKVCTGCRIWRECGRNSSAAAAAVGLRQPRWLRWCLNVLHDASASSSPRFVLLSWKRSGRYGQSFLSHFLHRQALWPCSRQQYRRGRHRGLFILSHYNWSAHGESLPVSSKLVRILTWPMIR
jgi:hypothetical protein